MPPKTFSPAHIHAFFRQGCSEIYDLYEERAAARSTGYAPLAVLTGAGKTYAAMRFAASLACQKLLAEKAAGDDDRFSTVVYSTPRRQNVAAEARKYREAVYALLQCQSLGGSDKAAARDRARLLRGMVICASSEDLFKDLIAWVGESREAGIARQMTGMRPEDVPAPVSPFPRKGRSGDARAFTALIREIIGRPRVRLTAEHKAEAEALWRIYDQAQRRRSDKNASPADDTLSGFFKGLRKIVIGVIAENGIDLKDFLALPTPEGAMCMPSVFFAHAGVPVALMTPSRMILPFSGFGTHKMELTESGPRPPSADDAAEARPCLILMDEADGSKESFARQAFDHLGENMTDIISLINRIAGTKPDQEFYHGEADVDRKIREMIAAAVKVRDELHLLDNIKVSKEALGGEEGPPPIVIGDAHLWQFSSASARYRMSLSEGVGHRLLPEQESGPYLGQFINEIEHGFDFELMTAMMDVVQLLERRRRTTAVTAEERAQVVRSAVVKDLLNQLRLDPDGRDPGLADFVSGRLNMRRKHADFPIVSVEETGVRLGRLSHSGNDARIRSDDTLGAFFASTTRTPEQNLLALCQNHLVLGLSATVEIPSVIVNFNAEFLRRRLGDGFVAMTDDERRRAYDAYQRARNYDAAVADGRLSVLVQSITDGDAEYYKTLLEVAARAVEGADAVSLLRPATTRDEDNARAYEISRLIKLLRAIRTFLTDGADRPETRGLRMIAFLNSGMRHRPGTDRADPALRLLLAEAVRIMGEEVGRRPQVKHLLAEDMKPGEEPDIPIGTHESPLILVTTPKTAGAGFNLQQRMDEPLSEVVRIGNRGSDDEIDYDTFYAELLTRSVLDEPRHEPAKLIQNAYALGLMGETGSISYKDMQHFQRLNVTSTCFLKEVTLPIKKTREYLRVQFSVISQCLGRITRTENRRGRIRILLDAELHGCLRRVDDVPRESVSWEMRQVIGAERPINQNAFGATDRRKHMTVRMKKHASGIINVLTGVMRGRAGAIAHWDRLTETALRSPVSWDEDDDVHIWAPHGATSYIVYASAEDLTRPPHSLFIDDEHGGRAVFAHRVSERESRLPVLMRSPVIRARFETRGYATSWAEKAPFVLSPAMFQAVYKARIAEQAVSALLLHAGHPVFRMEDGEYERFDFRAGARRLPVDVKNYGTSVLNDGRIIEKSFSKMGGLNAADAVVVNTVLPEDAPAGEPYRTITQGERRLHIINGVLDRDGATLGTALRHLGDLITEEGK